MKNNKDQGFSIIELLVAMAITGIAATAIYSVYVNSVESSIIQNTAANAQQSVRAGIELMAQDIRMAGYDSSGGAYTNSNEIPVRFLSTSSILITADRNESGEIDGWFDKLTYYLDGTILRQRSHDRGGEPIINNVEELIFSRFPATGDLVAVDIELTVLESAGRNNTEIRRNLTKRVHLRNSQF